ncbi:LysR family transcriptional regulator [Phycobacter azelaicus]|uniref:LysR family transcriptional regulator n=1 Tax=Phycobacter azelaicus TaxID=2668075 RepID=UPI001867AAA6|nr:LysR family transcriptional regulator [Phycobacter azelaicus]MBE1297663.1 LysR family transcriptional regulator [Paracoccaceae bacterium]
MAIKIEMLRCFAAVAHAGTLGAAARQLGRTPSAVSMTLKQLEEHLGEPLFETDRKNRLTALGVFVLEEADRELQHFDLTVRAMEGFASARKGHVRVAAVPSVAGSLLPQAISEFIARFPDVRVEVWDMASGDVISAVEQDQADIGIATGGESATMAHRSIHSAGLMSDAFGVICSSDHPLANPGGPLPWQSLLDHRLITNPLSAGMRSEESKALHANAQVRGHNVTSILAMVRAGLGYSILPEMTMQLPGASALVFRPLADPEARRHLHLMHKADRPLLPAVKELSRQIRRLSAPFQG